MNTPTALNNSLVSEESVQKNEVYEDKSHIADTQRTEFKSLKKKSSCSAKLKMLSRVSFGQPNRFFKNDDQTTYYSWSFLSIILQLGLLFYMVNILINSY
jgi:hypothetical protein